MKGKQEEFCRKNNGQFFSETWMGLLEESSSLPLPHFVRNSYKASLSLHSLCNIALKLVNTTITQHYEKQCLNYCSKFVPNVIMNAASLNYFNKKQLCWCGAAICLSLMINF